MNRISQQIFNLAVVDITQVNSARNENLDEKKKKKTFDKGSLSIFICGPLEGTGNDRTQKDQKNTSLSIAYQQMEIVNISGLSESTNHCQRWANRNINLFELIPCKLIIFIILSYEKERQQRRIHLFFFPKSISQIRPLKL